MKYFNAFLICQLISLLCFIETAPIDSDDEFAWTSSMGNTRNTRRLSPSLATNYNGSSWNYVYNSSSQDTTVFGVGIGINGDLYSYLSTSRYSSADLMLCLTPNGETRWKMYLESVPRMTVVGVSNIISNREDNTLIYTSTWADAGSFVSKICRVYYPETKHPAQECVTNENIFIQFSSSILLDVKANLLITSVIDNRPAAFNASTFELVWVNKEIMGADLGSGYRTDLLTGDIYWIGGDDSFRKMNSTGICLIDSDANSGGTREFALDSSHQIMIRAWQNMTDRRWPIVLSAWNIDNTNMNVRWEWNSINMNSTTSTDCTPPIIDNQYNLTYFANLPYAIAVDTMTGVSKWQSQIVTSDEMDRLNLISTCITFNEHTRILYVLVQSQYTYPTLSLIALHADSGKILRRINILKKESNDVEEKKITIRDCPILIGNDMIYISWLLGDYPELVPLNIIGISQLS